MRQLVPQPHESIDVYDSARPPHGRWLRANFVASLDGRIVDRDGRSAGLGGEGDRQMFRALRAHADAILVGAGTVRAERYGPHRVAQELAPRRVRDGRARPAAVAVVSASLDLDFDSELFTAAVTPTVVMTHASTPADRRRRAEEAGRLLVAGREHVDLAEGLRLLRAQGFDSILCEGGPELFAALVQQGLVDELCLTLSPMLVGRDGPSVVRDLPADERARLDWAAEQGSELFLRYTLRHGT